MKKKTTEGTFTPNFVEPIHRWYPYIEGYSSKLVGDELDALSLDKGAKVYDPFGGTGTTPLASCMRGYEGLYSETNPFMRFVVETKTNCIRRIINDQESASQLCALVDELKSKISTTQVNKVNTNDAVFAKYFDEEPFQAILNIKEAIRTLSNDDISDIAKLALSAILVPTSRMIRRGDLRFAKEHELKKKRRDVNKVFFEKLEDMVFDIHQFGNQIIEPSRCLSPDARDIDLVNDIDCIITSPPYLNGTNYIRNTKLELFLNGFATEGHGLSKLHSKGIVAGINNVSKSTQVNKYPEIVKEYYEALLPVAYDKRIPTMVTSYFADMDKVFSKMSRALKRHGMLIMDIGDSQFAGIHIPTHDLLVRIAQQHGFSLVEEEILRTRRSKNGTALTQRILRLRLEECGA